MWFERWFGRKNQKEAGIVVGSATAYTKIAVEKQYDRYTELADLVGKKPKPGKFAISNTHCRIKAELYDYNDSSVVDLATSFVDNYAQKVAKKQQKQAEEQKNRDEYRPKYQELEARIKKLGGKLKLKDWGVKATIPRRRKSSWRVLYLYYGEYDYCLLYHKVVKLEEIHAERLKHIEAHETLY